MLFQWQFWATMLPLDLLLALTRETRWQPIIIGASLAAAYLAGNSVRK